MLGQSEKTSLTREGSKDAKKLFYVLTYSTEFELVKFWAKKTVF